jgi:hypothetical protein
VGCSLFFRRFYFSLCSFLYLGLGLFSSAFPCYNCSCPKGYTSLCLVGCAVSVLASSSVFVGLVSVGFSGSRSPSPGASAALSSLLPLVPSGVRVSVGCARGVDSLCRSFFAGSSSLLVFSVASGWFGSGRSAFARRSSRCVLSVAAGSAGVLVALPSAGVCPTCGQVLCRSFFGAGSGSWGSVAFALGRGRRVLLWLPAGCLPPSWSGVSWSSAGVMRSESFRAFGSVGCWWLGVSVPAPAQLSLF